ncbi:hypothetical protein [Paenibacillus naphthalenovorans]|uniref:hypothetical protein n=1 Tax=Paenibacillus naphthalenovorans TaxID=162209 RepID=UPI003D26DD19
MTKISHSKFDDNVNGVITMFNDKSRKITRPVRHQFPITWAEYNGGPEHDYEDAADYLRPTSTIRAVKVG